MIRIAAVLVALAYASSAHAGVFGIEPGTPVSKLTILKTLSPGVYRVKAPIPNPAFQDYTVMATSKVGVCKIMGSGPTIRNDSTGSIVRSEFRTLATILDKKYGPGEHYDYLAAGSIWDGSTEWAKGVEQRERSFVTFWAGDGNTPLPGEITGIQLEAQAISASDTYVTLKYEFSNVAACKADMEGVKSQGL